MNERCILVAACVEVEQGTVDRFIGDSVMAFWGAPDEQSDHATRACRTVIAIARSLAAANAEQTGNHLPPIRIRIGISSGRVLVGNIGAPGRVNCTIVWLANPVDTD